MKTAWAIGLGWALVMGLVAYYGSYVPAAAQLAREEASGPRAKAGCLALLDAADRGELTWTWREERYCRIP